MPAQVTNYKCPACTGPLHFGERSGKLECDYCGSTFTVAEVEALYASEDEQAAQAAAQLDQVQQAAQNARDEGAWQEAEHTSWGADEAHMRAYSCPSCGAELICDDTTAATSCPYCGNPTIVPGQFSGVLRPDYVIPFKLDKAAAVQALKNHYKGKKLLPKTFTDSNHIEEIKGVYVPFWLYDGQADADLIFRATRSHVHTRGNQEITVTEHFQVRRAGTVDFDRIPVDASSRMPDEHMDAIEPFDYSELKPFSNAYLPGFLADKYDVSQEECAKRADLRAENTAVDTIASTVTGYSSVTPVARNIRLKRGKVHYALLPVWLLNTKWQNQNFLFAMNGQTGKIVGDLPVSRGRYWAWFAGIAGGLAAVVGAVLWLLM